MSEQIQLLKSDNAATKQSNSQVQETLEVLKLEYDSNVTELKEINADTMPLSVLVTEPSNMDEIVLNEGFGRYMSTQDTVDQIPDSLEDEVQLERRRENIQRAPHKVRKAPLTSYGLL